MPRIALRCRPTLADWIPDAIAGVCPSCLPSHGVLIFMTAWTPTVLPLRTSLRSTRHSMSMTVVSLRWAGMPCTPSKPRRRQGRPTRQLRSDSHPACLRRLRRRRSPRQLGPRPAAHHRRDRPQTRRPERLLHASAPLGHGADPGLAHRPPPPGPRLRNPPRNVRGHDPMCRPRWNAPPSHPRQTRHPPTTPHPQHTRLTAMWNALSVVVVATPGRPRRHHVRADPEPAFGRAGARRRGRRWRLPPTSSSPVTAPSSTACPMRIRTRRTPVRSKASEGCITVPAWQSPLV